MSSHRRLVHRHMHRLLSNKERDLLPGQVGFNSFYQPSLQGGTHDLSAIQTVHVEGKAPETIKSDVQQFNVIAPRYNLPTGVVDLVYPPTGESVPVTVLPHIVFKDPHMPWERSPTYINEKKENADKRNLAPWMVLLVFSLDELKLDKEKELDPFLQGIAGIENKQSETMSVRMRVKDTPKLSKVYNTIPYNETLDTHDADGPVDVIFIKKDLFDPIFIGIDEVTKQPRLDVAQYKYMSHVRRVPTDGMASADVDEDTGIFSISVSPRTGPLDLKGPETVVVHLVSLDMNPTLKLPVDSERVALTSLHSWTYTCLPDEGDTSPKERLKRLGQNLTLLLPQMPDTAPKPTPRATSSAEDIVAKRQADGYSIVRHRTITGDVTAAITRGPLVPNPVQHPLRDNFCMQSNFGSDLQILDQDLGLMDITYSAAWQLGKTLGMGDEAFSAALTRLRNVIHAEGLGQSKVDVHSAIGTYKSRRDTVVGMRDLVKGLNTLTQKLHEHGDAATAVDVNRWDYTSGSDDADSPYIDTSMSSPHISSRMQSHTNAAALASAMATDGTMYNEHNCPENSDFAMVYSWVLDKLHLSNVPAHYLIPDPSYLPLETLRFFYVDENWTDALVDGALSLANHWGAAPMEDYCRTAIKTAINTKLKLPDETLGGWHTPMPRYGFILRSQLLVQFPDITVTPVYAEVRNNWHINGGAPEAPKAPILVQKRLSTDSMYCLFDCFPGDLQKITFTMPPHQQRFKIGDSITETTLEVKVRRIYTQWEKAKRKEDSHDPIETILFEMAEGKAFDLKSRMMKVEPYVDAVRVSLKKGMEESDFTQDANTSALMALHLNESIPELVIQAPKPPTAAGSTAAAGQHTFQFSLPEVPLVIPPPLEARARQMTPRYATMIRPRPASPRREAALVTEYANRQITEQKRLQAESALSLNRDAKTTQRPEFDVNVYALRYQDKTAVPSNSPFPIDLVVKIVRSPDSYIPKWPLEKIDVSIPWGNIPPDGIGKNIPLLSREADPPMPMMLSNMRFNVLKFWSDQKGSRRDETQEKGTLRLSVVPRNPNGVTIDKMQEASFMVPRAKIVTWKSEDTLSATVHVRFQFADDVPPYHTDFTQSVTVDFHSMNLTP